MNKEVMMPKYLITLPTMPMDKVKSAWKSVIKASGGSNPIIERAYIDETKGQAICCWNAAEWESVEELFSKAQIKPESIREVIEYGK